MNRRHFLRNGLWVTGTLAFPAIVRAGVLPGRTRIATPAPPATSGITYLVSEDCESGVTPDGWTNAVSPTWNYNTSPAPLIGNYSWKSGGSSSLSYTTYTGTGDVWAFCHFTMSAQTNPLNMLYLRDASANSIAYASIRTTGALRAYNGTSYQATAAGAVSIDVEYAIWVHYTKGTGANGVTNVYLVTGSETRPSLTIGVTTGNATADAAQILLMGADSSTTIIDKIRVSASEIGDNPT